MKKIAFIFSHAAHGTSFGKEGLDVILSTSSVIQDISIFFIGDGIFQFVKHQKPKSILSRDYASSFCILPLYGINKFYFCHDSLIERGILNYDIFLLEISILDTMSFQKKINQCEGIINF
ncbi:sulfurtransferase complex subunit TusC [Buchnera aphidicola (Formosaphis micheliae)]|uniref:sulfurtransferase complex subunit TusC n=1 Tax=Buchnera aphidicola TaxID=9 RepID=UPI0031CCD352